MKLLAIMRTVLDLVLGMLGLAAGLMLVIAFSDPVNQFYAIFVSLTFAYIGLAVGEMIWRFMSPQEKPLSTHLGPTRRTNVPHSFGDRLSNFVANDHPTPSTMKEPFQSKMAFWTSTKSFDRTPPRPTSFIRMILYRIRTLLNSNQAGNS